ncbi:MAG: hypothetical protein GC129_01235 [Proteobacteria bacterium]|nr:hypothetical protein [Pseudomonadota bacterium]
MTLAALCYVLAKPIWDWDVIGYLALAKHLLGHDWVSTHQWVYGLVDQLPEAWRTDLLGREDFRRVVAHDPEALRQVSAFYAERVGYYGLLAMLIALKVPGLVAVRVLSVLALLLVASGSWLWLKKICGTAGWRGWLAVFLLAVVLAFPSVMKVLRWSNPDGLVAGCYLLGVYAYLRGREQGWLAAWLAMVVLRPNTALWLAPLALYEIATQRWQRGWVLGCIGALAVTLHNIFPAYGAMVGWHHTFVGAFAYPESLRLPFSWDFYRMWLGEKMLGLHGRDLLLFMLMWASLGVVGWKGNVRMSWVAAALAGGVLVQVLVFPGFWERLYVGPVLTLLLLAASCVRGVTWAKA